MERTPELELTPEIVLQAYSIGLFPMAEHATDTHIFWLDPPQRGIFPLDAINISRRFARQIRQDHFRVTANLAFEQVIEHCATLTQARRETWINPLIKQLYNELHQMGHAHSIEVWQGEALAGGLYGVSLGGAFFGESMFHLAPNASKAALAHLVARLRFAGFQLLDAQFLTPHLASLGAIEIPRGEYKRLLKAALKSGADFTAPFSHRGADVLARLAD